MKFNQLCCVKLKTAVSGELEIRDEGGRGLLYKMFPVFALGLRKHQEPSIKRIGMSR
jgi:hypothetical protein